MDDAGQSLWERVCATVTRLGQPKGPRTRVEPLRVAAWDTILDLHGYKIEDAYQEVKAFLSWHEQAATRSVIIITGKSGVIRKEFPFWMEHLGHPFEILHGGGSFGVRI